MVGRLVWVLIWAVPLAIAISLVIGNVVEPRKMVVKPTPTLEMILKATPTPTFRGTIAPPLKQNRVPTIWVPADRKCKGITIITHWQTDERTYHSRIRCR